jgi:hypothetical protein
MNKIEFETYRIFSFVKNRKGETKKVRDFRRQVDLYHEIINKRYDGSSAPKKLEEILAQAVLTKVMPDYELIKIDDGSSSSQIDLIAQSKLNNHTIAIEVTQYADNNYSLIKSKERGEYPSEYTTRKWTVHVNNDIAPQIGRKQILRIDKILHNIEINFKPDEDIAILCSELDPYSKIDISALEKEFEVRYIFGEANLEHRENSKGKGSITIVLGGTFSPEGEEKTLEKILEIAYAECQKEDNKKKLSHNSAGERHLFVVMAFSFGKGLALEWLIEQFKNSTAINERNVPEEYVIISEIADVVWIGGLYDWTESGTRAFNLIKITKKKDEFIFDFIAYKEPYLNDSLILV